MSIILGSQSPRRKEILNYFSLPFQQIPSNFDEETILFLGDPHAYALAIAQKKGEDLLSRFPNDLILTADTVVYFDGNVYNKPKDREEATRFLSILAGQWHSVFTALTLRSKNGVHFGVEKTDILFNPLTDEQIQIYLDHCHFLDKAAGYAIQQTGSIIVQKINGCYYNVMGLPINLLKSLLLKENIDLWHYLKC